MIINHITEKVQSNVIVYRQCSKVSYLVSSTNFIPSENIASEICFIAYIYFVRKHVVIIVYII